ncbi:MAG: IS21 family transposase [Gammaproteobacteria bacterium]|nr:IS21 family transposase [Gammaproteobacteria bacterium]MCW5583775.1 IS21 family transposase [Gammaproteobacteria bacterium]
MISYEEFMEVKILFRQGKSIREISKTLHISRNTVRRYLRREEKPNYKMRRVQKPIKLAPFHDYLKNRVKDAHPHWLPATVLFQEIHEQGYDGGMTVLRAYLRTLKPIKEADPVVRFETRPGQQMQVDWIEFGRGKHHLSAFVATMGYSRASFVEFVTNERLETLLSCHEKAFEFFGGVPQEILYDNMKTVVLARDAYAPKQHRFHPGFLDFANHFGFIPKLCRPYRAKTKGKVERFNRFLRYSFYNPLVSRLKPLGLTVDIELGNYEVKRWLRDIANQRVHATTGQVPAVKLQEEKQWLQPLPAHYVGLNRKAPISRLLKTEEFSLQHPLSVYDKLLQEVVV